MALSSRSFTSTLNPVAALRATPPVTQDGNGGGVRGMSHLSRTVLGRDRATICPSISFDARIFECHLHEELLFTARAVSGCCPLVVMSYWPADARARQALQAHVFQIFRARDRSLVSN